MVNSSSSSSSSSSRWYTPLHPFVRDPPPPQVGVVMTPEEEIIHPQSSSSSSSSTISSSSFSSSSSSSSSIFSYLWQLILHLTDNTNSSSSTIRSTQARLTFFELLEHFDFFNDFLFIGRVLIALSLGTSGRDDSLGHFALWWLITIFFTSTLGYCLRPCLIYHRIPREDMKLFCPFLVFHQIKISGDRSPQVLYMYERLYWTYSLIMRFVEDIPQAIASSIWLWKYGRDAYAIIVICFSALLLILTTVRMGLTYPLAGTLSLILSTQPPVDSPVVSEATPTTYHITLYMAATMVFWTATHIVTLRYVTVPFQIVIMGLCVSSAISAIAFFSLWFYYSQQSEIDVDQQFMRGTSQVYPPPRHWFDRLEPDHHQPIITGLDVVRPSIELSKLDNH